MMVVDHLQYIRNNKKGESIYRLKLVQLTILMFLFFRFTDGNSDWLKSCSVCHCNWNSGKKTADCKGKSLSELPVDMSSEMQVIDLSNNMIAELKRQEFLEANFQNLHKLFMRNCTLQDLNRNALEGLAILIELDMSNNFIRVLHPGTFAGLTKLRNVVMNHNEIEVLDDHLFDNLPYLTRVEFKFNKLKHIGVHAFGDLPILGIVYLEANKLSVLRKEIFQQTPKLIYLSLSQNPWNCSCDLQEFRNFTIAKRLYTPPTDCFEPPRLRGKLWNEISSEDFACKPQILGSVRSFVEAQSNNITLPCRIEAAPRPNITWMINKRPVNINDHRIRIFNSFEENRFETNVITSELRIFGVRANDKGIYTCIADNGGGRAEAEFHLLVGDYFSSLDGIGANGVIGPSASDTQSNILLIICLIVMTFLLLLIIMVLVICWYCRRLRKYQKDSTIISDNEGISSKIEKTHNTSMLDGSVIMEMQKSLLTEINPVEKPPRRTELDGIDAGDEGHEMKKTLLEDLYLGNITQRDDETHSITLSDSIVPRNVCHAFVDDNYGTNLPPDLLSFPARVPTSPSMQSSQSNIPEQLIYGIRSPPLASPVYAHMTPHGIYGKTTIASASPNGFMTLQHPKSRNLALIAAVNSRQQQQQKQSPFVPAPVVYSPAATAAVVMKQGYMTIPRKPRIPSWTPSSTSVIHSSQLSELQSPMSPNPSETGTAATVEMQTEPVYDNLGLRTTAGGNSTSNLHKVQHSEQPVRYTMRDRPLPATPSLTSVASNSCIATPMLSHQQTPQVTFSSSTTTGPHLENHSASKIYEPILELVNYNQSSVSEKEPLYGSTRQHNNLTIVPNNLMKIGCSNNGETHNFVKIPPRPPPKPKKKMSVTATRSGQGSTSQLFDDEGEDGTEV